MEKELTLQEWQEIRSKTKEINDNLDELLILLSEKLPNKEYLYKWKSASKSFGNLRSHLDEIANSKYNEQTIPFYGSVNKY